MPKISQIDDPRSPEEAFDSDGRRYCDGWKVSGYWKGYRCCAFGKHLIGHFAFCGAHFAKAVEEMKDEQ